MWSRRGTRRRNTPATPSRRRRASKPTRRWPSTSRSDYAWNLTAIDRASYDPGMGASDSNETARKGSFGDAPLPARTDESDAFVEMWKRAWLSGADAYWATNSSVNPHAEGPARAAWQA